MKDFIKIFKGAFFFAFTTICISIGIPGFYYLIYKAGVYLFDSNAAGICVLLAALMCGVVYLGTLHDEIKYGKPNKSNS